VDTGVFFDDDSFVLSETAYVTNTNVDTGYTLTEVVHNTLHLDTSKATFKQAGLFVQLRDASGSSSSSRPGSCCVTPRRASCSRLRRP
jgi:hypothetical protein